jgi:hypothetical protein
MGSCAAPSAKGDDKFITTDYLQQCPIDGKTVRGSYDDSRGLGAIHMVNAFATENGVCLGQHKVYEKSNEITAIPELLQLLDISGCLVTIDAMGCQKKIAQRSLKKTLITCWP